VEASLLVSDGLRREARGRRIAEADIVFLPRAGVRLKTVFYALCEQEEVYGM
jgi:hypothetical protein